VTAVELSPELIAAWLARTVPADGGHLMWAGRARPTPVLRFGGRELSAARIAFLLGVGREPVGPVMAGCGVEHCVAPEHVDDTVRRQRDRVSLRLVLGIPADRPDVCVAGHDQAVHGRLHGDGLAYCQACKTARKARAAA